MNIVFFSINTGWGWWRRCEMGVCMLIKKKIGGKERSGGRRRLGHLLDLWCRDLVWLQLNPEGGFPVDLWSLSRRCRSDLYLPLPPRGNGDDFHDNGSDSRSISGRLSLLGPTMPRLYWQLQPWAPGPRRSLSPSANLLFLDHYKKKEKNKQPALPFVLQSFTSPGYITNAIQWEASAFHSRLFVWLLGWMRWISCADNFRTKLVHATKM